MWARVASGKSNINSNIKTIKVQHIDISKQSNPISPKRETKHDIPDHIKYPKEADGMLYNKEVMEKRLKGDQIKEKMKKIQKLFNEVNVTMLSNRTQHKIALLPMNKTSNKVSTIEFIDKLFCQLKDKIYIENNDLLSHIYQIINILKHTSKHIIRIKCLNILCNPFIWNKYSNNNQFMTKTVTIFQLIAMKRNPTYSSIISSAIKNAKFDMEFVLYSPLLYSLIFDLFENIDFSFYNYNDFKIFKDITEIMTTFQTATYIDYQILTTKMKCINDTLKELREECLIYIYTIGAEITISLSEQIKNKIIYYKQQIMANKLKYMSDDIILEWCMYLMKESTNMSNILYNPTYTSEIYSLIQKNCDKLIIDTEPIWNFIHQLLKYFKDNKNIKMYNKLIWNIFLHLNGKIHSGPFSDSGGTYLFNINPKEINKLLNKNTLQLFINCNVNQSIFNALDYISNYYDYYSYSQDIIKCIKTFLHLLNDNEQFNQYKHVEHIIGILFVDFWSHLWRYSTDTKKLEAFNHVIILILKVIETNDNDKINKLCLRLQSIQFIERIMSRKLESFDKIKLKLDKIYNIYAESFKRYHYSDIKSKNIKLCNGYINEHNELKFTKELTHIIIQYLGCYNRLHIIYDSIINYKSKQYEIININNEMVSIKDNSNNDIKKVKHGMIEKITWNSNIFSSNNQISFKQITEMNNNNIIPDARAQLNGNTLSNAQNDANNYNHDDFETKSMSNMVVNTHNQLNSRPNECGEDDDKSNEWNRINYKQININKRLVVPLFGKQKGELGKIKNVYHNQFATVSFYNKPTSFNGIILLDFLCPVKISRYMKDKNELLSTEYLFGMSLVTKATNKIQKSMVDKIKLLTGIPPSLCRFVKKTKNQAVTLSADYFSIRNRESKDMKTLQIESIINSLYSGKMNKKQKDNLKSINWIFCEIVPYSRYDVKKYNRFLNERDPSYKERIFSFGYDCQDWYYRHWYIHFLHTQCLTKYKKNEIKQYFGISIPDKRLSAIILHRK